MMIEERGKTDEGFEYIIGIHSDQGHRMGYVGVYPDSPLHSECYTVDTDDEDDEYTGIEYEVSVYGGLTFSGILRENIVGGYNPHYFGFDCAHLGDAKITPKEMELIYSNHLSEKSSTQIKALSNRYSMLYTITMDINEGTIKTLDFVRAECFGLSKQLKELEKDYGNV